MNENPKDKTLPDESRETEEKQDRKTLWIILLVLSLLLLLGGAAFYVFTHPFWVKQPDVSQFVSTSPKTVTEPTVPVAPTDPSSPEETTEPPVVHLPVPEITVDFDALQEVNPDAYAWIYIPMTIEGSSYDFTISLPMVQSRREEDDNFYLHHNLNRDYQYSGTIYTQKKNSKRFTDRVTVVYGHNMNNGWRDDAMFTNLTFFQDEEFFADHDKFYIFQPDRVLVYEIAAAISFDTRHILNCFDFSKDEVYQDWIDTYVLHPKTINPRVREGIDVTIDDKLVILSTCLAHGDYRLLIEGVLIDDVPIN